MSRPLGELPGFWKKENKVSQKKTSTQIKDRQTLVRQPHKLFTKCKEEDLHTKNQNIPNIWRKKSYTKFYVQKYGRENYDFTSKKILLYSRWKDKALNASKNKVKKNAIGS